MPWLHVQAFLLFQTQTAKLGKKTWAPLIYEINSLVETLHALDNDETKSMDIIGEHTKRIAKVIPSNPIDMWYPKPIHRLLSVKPLKRIEIPLDVLALLVSSGFNINDIGYNDGISDDSSNGDDNDVHESDVDESVDKNESDDAGDNDDPDDNDNDDNESDEYCMERMKCQHTANNDIGYYDNDSDNSSDDDGNDNDNNDIQESDDVYDTDDENNHK